MIFNGDSLANEKTISAILENSKFVSLETKVFTLSVWEDLFAGLLGYVNKTVLNSNWTLLDIGFCP